MKSTKSPSKTARKAGSKKKVTKDPNAPPKNGVVLVMDGSVSIVEYKGGKEISKSVLDGATVLQVLIKAITHGIDLMEADP